MKAETYKNKAKEIKEQREKLKDCPRNAKRIEALKAEEKRLNAKAKEKKAEEESRSAPKSNRTTISSNSRKSHPSKNISTPKTQTKSSSDPLTEKMRQGLCNYNGWYAEQFNAMDKNQLKNEVNGLVHQLIEDNVTCVQEGLKEFSNKQELINASIEEVCEQALHISTDEYNEFMKS